MNTTDAATIDPRSFRTFAEFYPFYLGERATGAAAIWLGRIKF